MTHPTVRRFFVVVVADVDTVALTFVGAVIAAASSIIIIATILYNGIYVVSEEEDIEIFCGQTQLCIASFSSFAPPLLLVLFASSVAGCRDEWRSNTL